MKKTKKPVNSTFNLGDRAMVVDPQGSHEAVIGDVGTVISIEDGYDDHVLITLDTGEGRLICMFDYRFTPVLETITRRLPSQGATKDTNPKDAVGIRKVPMSTISAPVLMEVGLGMMEGARKYGRHNYRVAGARASVYYDASLRHLFAWWEGQDIDPDSGLSHISKCIATLVVMRDAMINDQLVDDRPPKSKEGWMESLNQAASALIDKYPDAKPAITEKDKDEPR